MIFAESAIAEILQAKSRHVSVVVPVLTLITVAVSAINVEGALEIGDGLIERNRILGDGR